MKIILDIDTSQYSKDVAARLLEALDVVAVCVTGAPQMELAGFEGEYFFFNNKSIMGQELVVENNREMNEIPNEVGRFTEFIKNGQYTILTLSSGTALAKVILTAPTITEHIERVVLLEERSNVMRYTTQQQFEMDVFAIKIILESKVETILLTGRRNKEALASFLSEMDSFKYEPNYYVTVGTVLNSFYGGYIVDYIKALGRKANTHVIK